MKALAGFVISVSLLAPPSAFAQAPVSQDRPQFGLSGIRLACFSPQRAFSDSADGKAGIARLAALQEKQAREVAERNKTLQAQEEALQRSLAVLSDEARAQRTKDLQEFRIDVQRLIQAAQTDGSGL